MIKEILHIDENKCILKEENEIKIASKENNNYTFDEIAKLENRIDNISNEIKQTNYEYEGNKNAIKFTKIFRIAMIIFEILTFIVLHANYNIILTLFMMGISYSVAKIIWLGFCGTNATMKKRDIELPKHVEELKALEKSLKTELKKMKEIVNYKTKTPAISSIDNNNYMVNNSIYYAEKPELETQKSLKLTK